MVKEDIGYTPEHLSSTLAAFADEGFALRASYESWYTIFDNFRASSSSSNDPWSLLAQIYYHAISIFLSGLFDYRREFDSIPTPILSASEITTHVGAILSLTTLALNTTNIAGALYMFPLRVAGARAVNNAQRKLILDMLSEISDRSFVVAQAFTADLTAVWAATGEGPEKYIAEL